MEKKISVIMGIFNCEETLCEAIESILNQSYPYIELIMCDDGSEDNTFEVANEYKKRFPEKIVLLRNEHNRGLNYTLNRCLECASGDFIARMDGDDRCDRNRLKVEMEVLDNEPDISIVSCDMEYFDETGLWGRISHPEYPEKKDIIKETPFCHAPCLVRKEAYEKVGGYSVDDRLLRAEDYHLWVKMYAAGFRGKNIHTPLYQMRDDRNAYNRRKFKYRLNSAYVKSIAVRALDQPGWMYVYCLRPIITGLLPKYIYDILHKKRLARMKKNES